MTRRLAALLLILGLVALTPLLAQGVAPTESVPDAQQVVGPPHGGPLTGDFLEKQTKDVAGLLRCPVCQGLSVYDSPAAMAVNMKHQVRDLLSRGYDREQILAYFQHSYGDFVLLEPTTKGISLWAWILPVIGLLLGVVAVRYVLKSLTRGPANAGEVEAPAEESTQVDPLPEDAELARYVLKVRELAYGWPGGVRPKSN